MILRTLHLYPALDEFPVEMTSSFRYQTRCLCTFLERTALKPLRFRTEKFLRLCVIGTRMPNKGCFVNSCHVASVRVLLKAARYSTVGGNDLQELYIELLQQGLNRCNEVFPLPMAALQKGIIAFRDNAYRNEWVHVTRKFRSPRITASLKCELTMDEFRLILTVMDETHVILQQRVLSTPPDEIHYSHRFDDIIIVNDGLVVTSKESEPLTIVPLVKFISV